MIDREWQKILKEETQKDYYKKLTEFVYAEYERYAVYPPRSQVFRALRMPPGDVRVVILGQDPYHNPGQACGLAFSVPEGVAPPPSLVNIYKELQSELGCSIPKSGCLDHWEEQGVMLLNTVLTVRAGQAASHSGQGWEIFTDAVLKALNDNDSPKVFMLFGRPAGQKRALITNPRHSILTAPHPSPLSAHRGFFGCGVFKRANEILKSAGRGEIDWQIP